MPDSSPKPKRNVWTSIDLLKHEGFVLAGAPVAMYVASFAWQIGYADFFRIPREFVSVNLETFLSIAALLISAVVPMVYMYDLFSLYIRKNDSSRPELGRRVMLLAMTIIPGIAVPLTLSAPLKAYIYWILPAVIYFIIWMVMPLIILKQGTWEERWAADDEMDKSFEAPVKMFPRPIALMIFLSLVLVYVFHLSGKTWAMSKKTFLSSNPVIR